jgi:hypothetical protein
MANATGEAIKERFFASGPDAEAFIVDTLDELGKSAAKAGRLD